jgi:predicted MPP superfamily phosphohydrolase
VDSHDHPALRPRFGRRRLLAGAAAVTGAGALDAFFVEPSWLQVREHPVPIPGLPAAHEGRRVAHVTDAHLRSFGRVERAIVETVRSLDVQLVVLTGDIVDGAEGLGVLRELCSGLRAAGAQVVATLGNWEHWGGFSAAGLSAEYARVGARLLVDEAAVIEGVTVVATDDGYAGAPRWDRTLSSFSSLARSDGPRLLCTHSPAMFDLAPAEAPRCDLALAGHTHGGQLRVGPWAPLVPPGSGRFVAGFYETRLGRAYVSRGTGTSIVPARFLCRPELPVFRLGRG